MIGDTRLDANVAPALRSALTAPIEAGHQVIIVDLQQVKFMDSSALGAFIAAVKRLGSAGTIAVVGLRGPVERLFSLTRMDKVFAIHSDVDAAVAALSEQS